MKIEGNKSALPDRLLFLRRRSRSCGMCQRWWWRQVNAAGYKRVTNSVASALRLNAFFFSFKRPLVFTELWRRKTLRRSNFNSQSRTGTFRAFVQMQKLKLKCRNLFLTYIKITKKIDLYISDKKKL